MLNYRNAVMGLSSPSLEYQYNKKEETMNQREKKIAIIGYELGVKHERERIERQAETYCRRKTDSPLGMSLCWANHANWDELKGKLEGE